MFTEILSTIGSVAGPLIGMVGQSNANSANRDQSRENNEIAVHQSNTAHQREVKDLVAAGLNPILSANKGAPMAQLSSANQENTAEGFEQIAQTAMQLQQMKQAMDKGKEEIGLLKAQKLKTDTETRVMSKDAELNELKADIIRSIKPGLDNVKGFLGTGAKIIKDFTGTSEDTAPERVQQQWKKLHEQTFHSAKPAPQPKPTTRNKEEAFKQYWRDR